MNSLPVVRLPAPWQPAATALQGRVILVTGAYGGLGSAVQEAFTVSPDGGTPPALHLLHLAVKGMPTSGTPQELLNAAGINASHIMAAVRSLAVTH